MEESKQNKSIVKLNIGGTRIETLRSTLEKLDYFKAKFQRWSCDDEEVFVDYDYSLFNEMLNKLRNDAYHINMDHNMIATFDFFGYSVEANNYIEKIPYLLKSNSAHHESLGYGRTRTTLSYVIDTSKVDIIMFAFPHYAFDINILYTICNYQLQITIREYEIYFKISKDYCIMKKYFLEKLQNRGIINITFGGLSVSQLFAIMVQDK